MLSRFKPYYLMAVVLAVPGIASADRLAETIDQYMTVRESMGQFSGSVLVARQGKVVLRKGYGYANVEKRIPFTAETRQRAASIAKMFTAMAVLTLREAGRLDLEKSICTYLSECQDSWQQVTASHLIHHESGIPDYEARLGLGSAEYMAFMGQEDATSTILEQARERPLDFAPGERFQYSNTGYVVLGHLIEQVASLPFETYVTENVLEQAGMNHSGVLGTGDPVTGMAVGYTHDQLEWGADVEGRPLTDGHLERVPDLAFAPPAGDAWLYTTVDDLYQWSRVMEGEGFVADELIREIYETGDGFYGYGWFAGEAYGRFRVRHNGEIPGYRSNFIRFPDERITIILLSNLDKAPLSHISRDLTSMVLGEPYDPPVQGAAVALKPGEIDRLVGVYSLENGDVLEVRRSEDHATVSLAGRYRSELVPLSETRFYFPLGDGLVVFPDEEGPAQSLNLRYSGKDHPATRVRAGAPADHSK